MGPLVRDEVGFPTESFPALGTFIGLFTQVGALKAYKLSNFPALGWHLPVVLTGGVPLGTPGATVSLRITFPVRLLNAFPFGHF